MKAKKSIFQVITDEARQSIMRTISESPAIGAQEITDAFLTDAVQAWTMPWCMKHQEIGGILNSQSFVK